MNKQLTITRKGKYSLVRDLTTYKYLVVNTKTGCMVGWGINYSQALQVLNEIA